MTQIKEKKRLISDIKLLVIKKRGFTLIELLVVVAIIGILATVVAVNLSNSQKKARDAVRLSDMKTISDALELYFQDDGGGRYYPGDGNSSDNTNPICWDLNNGTKCGGGSGRAFLPSLVPKYLTKAPDDPINDAATYRYSYYRYGADSSGYYCRSTTKRFYVLGIRKMEINAGSVDPNSPGFCPANTLVTNPSYAWSDPTRFRWVTGRIEP